MNNNCTSDLLFTVICYAINGKTSKIFQIYFQITTKLAGDVEGTAAWMTNVANENGEILNSVLTTGEGVGLIDMCQGIVKRYENAKEAEPEVIYVDRDCCNEKGLPPVLSLFHPWKCHVRLDIFHFMRRFTKALVTEHHPLYGTFCSRLSSCIFEWEEDDIFRLRMAKKSELKKEYGHEPTETQINRSITSAEYAKHCRRRTRGVEETRKQIKTLLNAMWDCVDSAGIRLINAEVMTKVWETQQNHLACIQDVPGVKLYSKVGTSTKAGKQLDVLKCARGSSSLESFHRHQCNFIPG